MFVRDEARVQGQPSAAAHDGYSKIYVIQG
jgi:hypothetical protein